MVRRKGELNGTAIDRGWPFQVALPEDRCTGGNFEIHRAFCRDLSLCPRGHTVRRDGRYYHVFCFADAAHADLFRAAFGGERFDPRQRGRGSRWFEWRKP
jgi:hypothetical protein